MMGVEFIDRFSTEWGFSVYDVMSEWHRILMYASQEKLFKKQILKSSSPHIFLNIIHVDHPCWVKLQYNKFLKTIMDKRIG